MNKNAALLYRETIVQTATPVGLITLLHEEAIRSLNQALHGLREKNLEKRTRNSDNRVSAVDSRF